MGTRAGDGAAMEREQREIEQAASSIETEALDLSGQIDALLNEVEQATGAPVRDAGPVAAAASTPEAISLPEVPDESQSVLAGELEAALKEASDALEQVFPPEDPPVAIENEVTGAEAAPSESDGMTRAHAEQAAEPVDESTAEGVGNPAIDLGELDALLAQQAEELEQVGREAIAAPTIAPVPGAEPEQAADGLSEGRLVSAQIASDASATGHSTAHSTVVPAEPSPAMSGVVASSIAAVPAVPPQTREVAPTRRKIAFGPLFASAGNALGMPLALIPAPARDAVAYLAAVTLFNALAVWGYMLFVYKAPVPPPVHDAPALHAVQPVPDAHSDPHAAPASDGHHGTESADSHPSPLKAQASVEETGHAAPAHAETPGHDAHESAQH